MDLASAEPVRQTRRTGIVTAHRVLAAALLVVGLILLAIAIRAAGGDFGAQGPRLAPVVVTGAWVAVAAVYLVEQVRPGHGVEKADVAGEAPDDSTEEGPHDGTQGVGWLAPAGVAAALVGFAIGLEYAGFVVSAAVFFLVCARFLGSRSLVRDVVVAVVLPTLIYLAFTRLLDLFLPAGVFPL
jgi:putative tricarboxylic transport membrane protein